MNQVTVVSLFILSSLFSINFLSALNGVKQVLTRDKNRSFRKFQKFSKCNAVPCENSDSFSQNFETFEVIKGTWKVKHPLLATHTQRTCHSERGVCGRWSRSDPLRRSSHPALDSYSLRWGSCVCPIRSTSLLTRIIRNDIFRTRCDDRRADVSN